MKGHDDIMIEMIREFFNRKGHKWDYPMSINSYRNEGDKILVWYNITHPIISFKKEKFINFRFPWSKKEEEEEAAKPSLALIGLDRRKYEFKVACRESDRRNEKIDNILYGSS